jgi:hypothetical protein
MPTPQKNIEIERIEELLNIDMLDRLNEHFIGTFLRQIETQPQELLRIFRKNLGDILMEREHDQMGHLKPESLFEIVDFSKMQLWLVEAGMNERAAKNTVKGIQRRTTSELSRFIHTQAYRSNERKDISDILLESGMREEDVSRFATIIHETELGVNEITRQAFKLNYFAEHSVRRESLRGAMLLKETITLYLYTVLQVMTSACGLEEETIAEIARRLGLCNNMKRQFLIVKQLERYFFTASSVEETKNKSTDFWIKLINDHELKIALEQYVTDDKLKKSDMEIAELYVEAHHIFDDVSEFNDETLAVISITYRLDNPEESGHTVEEILAMIDQIKLLTTEFGPLGILTRDIFAFFEILGECDHHNHSFRKTILTFRAQLRKLSETNKKTGQRATLNQLVLTYLYSRLDAFLEDVEKNKNKLLESIRNRLAHCHDLARQFAIVDQLEKHMFENPGLVQIADENYWQELINTFELNIMLEIYIDNEYLVPGQKTMTKNQMLDRLQAQVNGIDDISAKSLLVVFLTAHLSALLDRCKEQTLSFDEITETIGQMQKDATLAAKQIDVQSRIKRELLSELTEKLFRLEAIRSSLAITDDSEFSNRLDEVVAGFQTRRDHLMEGKMDPHVMEEDIHDYLSDKKVIQLIEESEQIYKAELGRHPKETNAPPKK